MGFFGFGKKKEREVAEVYMGLRNQILTLEPAQIDLVDKGNQVFAILMETGYEQAVVTLSVVADGTVSLYFSHGGGILGLGGHEGPQKAGLEFIAFAKEYLSYAQPTNQHPLPDTGETVFYFITANGVLNSKAKEKDLGNNKNKFSPLFHKGHEVISEARLVEEKRQIEFKELMNAAATGDEIKIKNIIKNKNNINITDHTGLNALMVAAHSGQLRVIELLIEAGCPIDAKDEKGYTALMFGCNTGQLDCVRYLVEKGANIHEVDSTNSTPLMFCAQYGHNDVVIFLLGKGADPNKKGNHGLSAIGFAQQNNLPETEKILRGSV